MDFRLYKVLAAHGAGQIEFGTFDRDTSELRAAYAELSALFDATADQLDAFSLSGYINDIRNSEPARPDDDGNIQKTNSLPKDSDYKEVLKVFPEPRLAKKIFGTMENARIDNRLRQTYRGLAQRPGSDAAFLREEPPVHLRSADASGAVRAAVPDHALRRRN